MATTGGKTHIVQLSPDGLGAGWSNSVRVDGLGRSGELVELTVRGDVGDATAGTATVILFAAELPADYLQGPSRAPQPTSIAVADLDPDSIVDAYVFAEVSTLTVAAHATDKSDGVSFRPNSPALYGLPNNKYYLWLAVKGVTGVVHVGLKAKGD